MSNSYGEQCVTLSSTIKFDPNLINWRFLKLWIFERMQIQIWGLHSSPNTFQWVTTRTLQDHHHYANDESLNNLSASQIEISNIINLHLLTSLIHLFHIFDPSLLSDPLLLSMKTIRIVWRLSQTFWNIKDRDFRRPHDRTFRNHFPIVVF